MPRLSLVSNHFHFAFAPEYRLPALLFGITPMTAWVEIGKHELRVRYGGWRLRTPVANISGVSLSGGYTRLRTLGPPRLSLSDRGVSFTTNSERGVCVQFREPVRAIDPTGILRHPGATMTVEDPDGFADAVRAAAGL